MTEPTITQADRDAAHEFIRSLPLAAQMTMHTPFRTYEAFARHREAAEQATVDAIVAWLERDPYFKPFSTSDKVFGLVVTIISTIQSGEWRKK